MAAVWDNPIQFFTACLTLVAILVGIRRSIVDVAVARASMRHGDATYEREGRAEDRESSVRDNEANAALVGAITTGWHVIAQQQNATIAGLESRIKHLEQQIDGNQEQHEAELEARDNKIREYRTKLHAANGELAKVGMMQFLVDSGALPPVGPGIPVIAPERRAETVVPPASESGPEA